MDEAGGSSHSRLQSHWLQKRATLRKTLQDEEEFLNEMFSELQRWKLVALQAKKEKEDLLDEMADLKDTLDASRRLQEAICCVRRPFLHPPPEILHMIFERTIPPEHLIPSSNPFCLNYLWPRVQEQKHAIINVCRAWHKVGLPFLYQDVSIFRVYQLTNLLRTLKHTGKPDLGNMIRTLRIQCYVPAWYTPYFERQLKVLLRICSRVTSCTIRPIGYFTLFPLQSALWVASAANITSLTLNDAFKQDILKSVLPIVSLHIIFLHFHIPPVVALETSSLNFPHLQHLSLCVPPIASSISRFMKLWDAPRLRRLTAALSDDFNSDLSAQYIEQICKQHGTKLEFLQISGSYRDLVKACLISCTSLRHIVVSEKVARGGLAHKTVEWLDIFFWPGDTQNDGDLPEMLAKTLEASRLPSLKGVRYISSYLLKISRNLPIIMPPAKYSTPSDAFTCTFLGWDARFTVEQVSCLRSNLVVEEFWNGDDSNSDSSDSDSSYVIGNSDDTESDGSDESRTLDYTTDSDSGDEAAQLNRFTFESDMTMLETDFSWLGD